MGPARQGVVTHFLSGKTPAPLRTRGADDAHCSRTRTVGTNARASLQARPPAPRCSGVPKATGSLWLDSVQRVRDRVNAYRRRVVGLDAPGILTCYRRSLV